MGSTLTLADDVTIGQLARIAKAFSLNHRLRLRWTK